jgi:exosortase F-associated protein
MDMKEIVVNNKYRITLIFLSFSLLVCIRVFEKQIFYDPLIQFYKSNFKVKSLPYLDYLKLFLSISFRYLINTIFSIALLFLIFKEKKLVVLSVWLYFSFYIILINLFFLLLNSKSPDHLTLFYIRRFLIQPLFLVLFIPAFYYQRKSK